MSSARGLGGGSVESGARGVPLTAALVLCLTVAGPASGHADTLSRELLERAPGVVEYVKAHGYRNVGVLKFLVKRGDEPISDRVGLLNLSLATRLEIALVLANSFPEPLGIIHDASAQASLLAGANHLTRPGRQALLRGRYSLAWGDPRDKVKADAFLTGEVVVSPDLRRLTVAILAFDDEGDLLDQIVRFEATADALTLAEAGESFLIRGGFDKGEAVNMSPLLGATQQTHPGQHADAPVELEIYYDKRRIPLDLRGGRAVIQEPREGQAVSFVLRKVDRTQDRYGVALLVNGENTLFKEKCGPLHSWKWRLGPDRPTIAIKGYQTSDNKAEAFRVLSSEASRENAMYYGADVGTITLVVFRERQGGGEAPPSPINEAEDPAPISRGVFPAEPAKNLSALKRQLVTLARAPKDRGLLLPGTGINATVRRTQDFLPDPTPVMAATLTYYRP
jgi:hypothetical protein